MFFKLPVKFSDGDGVYKIIENVGGKRVAFFLMCEGAKKTTLKINLEDLSAETTNKKVRILSFKVL